MDMLEELRTIGIEEFIETYGTRELEALFLYIDERLHTLEHKVDRALSITHPLGD